jgi:hypothetical protein
VSASYEADRCQAPADLVPSCTRISRPPSRPSPIARARAGGRVRSTAAENQSADPRAGGFVVVRASSHAPPIRAGARHRSPETSYVKPGKRGLPSLGRFREEPGGYTEPRPSSARAARLRRLRFQDRTLRDGPGFQIPPPRNQQFARECDNADAPEAAALTEPLAIPPT